LIKGAIIGTEIIDSVLEIFSYVNDLLSLKKFLLV